MGFRTTPQHSPRLGVRNHAQGGAILDAAAGIEKLELGKDRGLWLGRNARQLHHWRRAYQLRDVGSDAQRGRS